MALDLLPNNEIDHIWLMKLFMIAVFGQKELGLDVWTAILAIVDRNIRVCRDNLNPNANQDQESIEVMHPKCSYYLLAWLGKNREKVPTDKIPNFELGHDYVSPKSTLKKLHKYLTPELPKDEEITSDLSLHTFSPFIDLKSEDILKCFWADDVYENENVFAFHVTSKKKLKKILKKKKGSRHESISSDSDNDNENDPKNINDPYSKITTSTQTVLEYVTFDEANLSDQDIQSTLALCVRNNIKIVITKHHRTKPCYVLLADEMVSIFRTSAKKSFEFFFKHISKKLSRLTMNGTLVQTVLAVVKNKEDRLKPTDAGIQLKASEMITLSELQGLLSREGS